MRDESGGVGFVFPDMPRENLLAETLRCYLKRAGEFANDDGLRPPADQVRGSFGEVFPALPSPRRIESV
jgi:hypothetical protein